MCLGTAKVNGSPIPMTARDERYGFGRNTVEVIHWFCAMQKIHISLHNCSPGGVFGGQMYQGFEK